ncbi:MAG: retention module-containing protein, partial [Pseudomonadota bacterium]
MASIYVSQEIAKVVALQGEAQARTPDGQVRTLKVGDVLLAGETVMAGPGAKLEIGFQNGEQVAVLANEQFALTPEVAADHVPNPDQAVIASAEVDNVIQAIEQGGNLDELLEETAAGLTGGGENGGNSFVRLLRITEEVGTQEFSYAGESGASQDVVGVTDANQAPLANPDAQTLGEDTASVSGNVLTGLGSELLGSEDSDPDLDPLTVAAVAFGDLPGVVGESLAGTWGDLVLNADGTYVYTPSPNAQSLGVDEVGVDVFTYTVTDPAGATTSTTLSFTVVGSNDAPVAGTVPGEPGEPVVTDPNLDPNTGNYRHEIPEDTSVSGAVRSTDPDGDPLTHALNTPPSNGTVVVNPDGSYTYTPNPNYNGNDSFTVIVDDGNGGTDIATVDIIITPVQDPSIITAGFGSVTEDTVFTTSGQLTITDVDGPQDQAFTPQTGVTGDHGSFSIDANGNWSYVLNNSDPQVQALNQGQTLTEVFAVTGVDGTPSTVTVVINGVNENTPPNAQNDSASTNEGTPVTINVLGNDSDPDGDPLTITGFNQPANGTVNLVNGQFVYTPNPGYVGSDTFTYTITDGQGGVDTATVTISMVGVQEPPVALNDTGSTNEDTPVVLTILGNDSDPDGTLDVTTVSIVTGPAHGSVVVNADGTVTYTPDANYNGPDSFEYTVRDNEGNVSNVATVNLTVDNTQEPPVALNDTGSTNEDTPVVLTILGNDSDPDGTLDVSTVTIVTGPSHGSVLVNADGTVTYTPDADYNGPDSF